VQTAVRDLWQSRGYPDRFGARFTITINQSGGWVYDDFLVQVEFDEDATAWCVYFRGTAVIHAQPVH
jgi:hypothetical protein